MEAGREGGGSQGESRMEEEEEEEVIMGCSSRWVGLAFLFLFLYPVSNFLLFGEIFTKFNLF